MLSLARRWLARRLVYAAPTRLRLPLFGLAGGIAESLPSSLVRLDIRSRLGRQSAPVSAWVLSPAVASAFGAVLDQRGRLVKELSFDLPGATDAQRWLDNSPAFEANNATLLPRILNVPSSVLSLVCAPAYQTNYYHWLFDVLPRLLIAEWTGYQYDFIYSETSLHFQTESLALLSYNEAQYIPAQRHRFVRASRLLIPDFPNSFLHLHEWVVEGLRARLIPNAQRIERKSPGSRLYVRRGATSRRRLLNDGEVSAALEKLGFQAIEPGRLTFAEQIAAFSRATVVVGLHGAELSNLVFSSPGVTVMEILPPRYQARTFAHLARAAGHKYHCILGNGERESNPNWAHQGDDVTVDLNRLLRMVETALTHES